MAGPDLCRAWEEIEAVTIAAVEGYCIGGAAALVVACDFRVMGAEAYLRLPEVPLGMNMSWRSIPRIAALVGPSRTKQFVMFGEAIDAERCAAWGFADEVTAKGEALEGARRWAAKVAALPPLPIRMTKEAVNAVTAATAAASIYMDRDQYLPTRTDDFREGVAAENGRSSGRNVGRRPSTVRSGRFPCEVAPVADPPGGPVNRSSASLQVYDGKTSERAGRPGRRRPSHNDCRIPADRPGPDPGHGASGRPPRHPPGVARREAGVQGR